MASEEELWNRIETMMEEFRVDRDHPRVAIELEKHCPKCKTEFVPTYAFCPYDGSHLKLRVLGRHP